MYGQPNNVYTIFSQNIDAINAYYAFVELYEAMN